MAKKKVKKSKGTLPADVPVSLTHTVSANGDYTVHRYHCLNCDTTESMIGGRQQKLAIIKKSQQHRCGVDSDPWAGRKDTNG